MTDRVSPTQGEASANLTSGAIRWAALDNWVVPSGDDYLASLTALTGTPLNGFEDSHSSTSLDVTIDTGEAFVGGRWMGRDVTTTVTLAASTADQTVYAGWESSTADSIVIGLDSAFDSADDGRRMALYDYDTDSNGVTVFTDFVNNEPIVSKATSATSADFASLADDADLFDGSDSTAFAKLAEDETISGSWDFDANVNVDATGHFDNVNIGSDTDYLRFGESSQRLWMAPIIGGSSRFGEEITYIPGSNLWRCETDWDVEGDLTVSGQTQLSGFVGIQGNIDFNQNEAQEFVVENRSNRPSSPSTGQMIYRSDKD